MLPRSDLKISEGLERKHNGKTAVIIGNGKSLNDVPRRLFENYKTFGANHIYLTLQPDYFVCVDSRNLLQYATEMYDVARDAEIAFLSDAHLDDGELYKLKNVYLCNEDTVRFPGEYWWTGGTATYFSLKVAYAMGFQTALLVGCDRDNEWAHFSDKYPGEYTPPERKRKQAYHLGIARLVYENDGRRVVNLSPPSDLDEFIERRRIEVYL